MELILVRHAETLWNQERRWQGHTDVPLSPIGIAHLNAGAEYTRTWRDSITQVYASDLSRAKNTAEGLFPDTPGILIDARLREIHLGEWEGKNRDGIAESFSDTFLAFDRAEDVKAPGGESFLESRERVWSWYQDHHTRWRDNDRVVVVAHGGTIRALLFALIPDLPGHLRNQFRVDNLSVSVLQSRPEQINIIHWNVPIEWYQGAPASD